MTSTTGKRLDKIEANLKPQAAFLVWWAEARTYPSISAFATMLKDAPESNYPLYRLPHQVEQAVRQAHKGQHPELIYQAVRRAVKDVAFLYFVQSECNTRLMGDWRAACLQLALVASHLGRLFEHELPRRDELPRTRHLTLAGLTEFWEWEAAVRLLADRYFGGESPLFPAGAEQLAAMAAEAETLAALYNEHLDWLAFLATQPEPGPGRARRKRGASPVLVPAEPIDLDALRTQTAAGGRDLARHIVAMAQAEALRFMDEPRAALALVKRRLWPAED